jgi:hypothetical protein
VDGEPIGRFLCHCAICQSVYRRPFADTTVFWGKAVTLPETHDIEFRRLRPPPALRRGLCPHCANPVVAFMTAAGLSVGFVPSRNFEDPSELPEPAGHIFYDRRIADVADSLPKISGYWPSETYVGRRIFGALFRSAQNRPRATS